MAEYHSLVFDLWRVCLCLNALAFVVAFIVALCAVWIGKIRIHKEKEIRVVRKNDCVIVMVPNE